MRVDGHIKQQYRGMKGLASGGSTVSAATCPSMDQLMGIVDPSDPCQSIALAASTCMPVGSTGPLAPGQSYCSPSTASLALGGGGTPVVSTNTYIAIAAIAGIFLLIGVSR